MSAPVVRAWPAVVPALGLLLSACGGGEAPAPKAAPPPPGTVVLSPEQIRFAGILSETARAAEVHGELSVPAEIHAVAGHEAELTAPFAGLFAIPAGSTILRPGDRVEAGELLGWIDERLAATQAIDLQVRRAEQDAQVRAAASEVTLRGEALDRARELEAVGGASVAELQAARDAFVQARARLTAARRSARLLRVAREAAVPNRRRAAIVAPFDGVVLATQAVPGAQVAPGGRLYTIADPSSVWIDGSLFEADAARVDPSARAAVLVPGMTRTLPVAPVALGPAVDPDTRAEAARYLLENPAGLARIGMSATLLLATRERFAALLVPAPAVVLTPAGSVVFVDEGDGRYVQRSIDVCEEWPLLATADPAPASAPASPAPASAPAQATARPVAVCGGLSRSDRVVVRGAALLWGESQVVHAPAGGGEEEDTD